MVRVRGKKANKVTKATDHPQWSRKKFGSLANGALVSGIVRQQKDALFSPMPDLVPLSLEVANKQSHLHSAVQHPSFSAATVSIELLEHPIEFVPATRLTFDAEMTVLKPRKTVKNISNEHRKRCEKTSMIPRDWPSATKEKRLGLPNPHVLCYRRSTLQAFLHMPIFVNWTRTIRQRHRAINKHAPDFRCMICDFSKLADAAWSRSGSVCQGALADLDRAFVKTASRYAHYTWITRARQADSHEFLSYFVQELEAGFKVPTTVQGMFKLRVQSEWKCQHCHYTHTANPVDETGLSVQIQHPKKGGLLDYIKEYFSDTALDARCENCQSKANRKRDRKIEAGPEFLFVHLQRFRYIAKGNRYAMSKDTKRVTFPKSLDLSVYGSDPILQRERAAFSYKLSSVVAHAGDLSSGHYIAYADAPGSGVQRFSDSSVKSVPFSEMLDPEGGFTPYILTYVRIEPGQNWGGSGMMLT